jgi:transcriptional regulator with XRE-family HTH domain
MKERGLRLKDVAQATSIPVSTLSEWTSGRTPRLDVDIVRLAQLLGTTLEDLVLGASTGSTFPPGPSVFQGKLKVIVEPLEEE